MGEKEGGKKTQCHELSRIVLFFGVVYWGKKGLLQIQDLTAAYSCKSIYCIYIYIHAWCIDVFLVHNIAYEILSL